MSYWNYRVLEKEGTLAIHGVYYDDNGKIQGWDQEPASPEAEDLDDLRASLESMLESLEKDIIKLDSISDNEE